MAQLNGFDATQEKQKSDCIPAGDYDLVVTKCDLKVTSAGAYQQVYLESKVLNGEFQNRTVFGHYNFSFLKGEPNDNQKKAVAIGRSQFAAICEAVKVPKPGSTEEIVGKTFRAKLKVKKSDEFGDQNQIAKAMPRDPNAPAAPSGEKGKW